MDFCSDGTISERNPARRFFVVPADFGLYFEAHDFAGQRKQYSHLRSRFQKGRFSDRHSTLADIDYVAINFLAVSLDGRWNLDWATKGPAALAHDQSERGFQSPSDGARGKGFLHQEIGLDLEPRNGCPDP